MKQLQVYGDRLFDKEGNEGGNPPEPPIVTKELDNETKVKLDRLAHLEKENKELIASRDKAKDAKRKEEEDKLKQQGELQKLLDAKEKELENLKTKADAFDELRTTEIEEAKKILGNQWLDEYANLSLATLRKTVQALDQRLKKIPGTDNGGISDPPAVSLTPQQKKEAHEKFPYMAPEKAEEAWNDVLNKLKTKKG